jgi:hypothetical protein
MILYLGGGLGNLLFQKIGYSVLEERKNVSVSDFFLKKSLVTQMIGWKIHTNYSDLIFRDTDRVSVLKALLALPLLRINVPHKTNTIAYFSYFQDKSFLRDHVDIIHRVINDFRDSISYIQVESKDLVIHVRGTDSKWSTSELKRLSPGILNGSVPVLVTDDNQKALEIFPQGVFYEGDVLMSFKVMALSECLVISNSTFSWWAAHMKTSGEVIMSKEMYEKLGFYNENVNLKLLE